MSFPANPVEGQTYKDYIYENGTWTDKKALPTSDGSGFEYTGTFDSSYMNGSTFQFGVYGWTKKGFFGSANITIYTDYIELIVYYTPTGPTEVINYLIRIPMFNIFEINCV